jgi:hypothetical protein
VLPLVFFPHLGGTTALYHFVETMTDGEQLKLLAVDDVSPPAVTIRSGESLTVELGIWLVIRTKPNSVMEQVASSSVFGLRELTHDSARLRNKCISSPQLTNTLTASKYFMGSLPAFHAPFRW